MDEREPVENHLAQLYASQGWAPPLDMGLAGQRATASVMDHQSVRDDQSYIGDRPVHRTPTWVSIPPARDWPQEPSNASHYTAFPDAAYPGGDGGPPVRPIGVPSPAVHARGAAELNGGEDEFEEYMNVDPNEVTDDQELYGYPTKRSGSGGRRFVGGFVSGLKRIPKSLSVFDRRPTRRGTGDTGQTHSSIQTPLPRYEEAPRLAVPPTVPEVYASPSMQPEMAEPPSAMPMIRDHSGGSGSYLHVSHSPSHSHTHSRHSRSRARSASSSSSDTDDLYAEHHPHSHRTHSAHRPASTSTHGSRTRVGHAPPLDDGTTLLDHAHAPVVPQPGHAGHVPSNIPPPSSPSSSFAMASPPTAPDYAKMPVTPYRPRPRNGASFVRALRALRDMPWGPDADGRIAADYIPAPKKGGEESWYPGTRKRPSLDLLAGENGVYMLPVSPPMAYAPVPYNYNPYAPEQDMDARDRPRGVQLADDGPVLQQGQQQQQQQFAYPYAPYPPGFMPTSVFMYHPPRLVRSPEPAQEVLTRQASQSQSQANSHTIRGVSPVPAGASTPVRVPMSPQGGGQMPPRGSTPAPGQMPARMASPMQGSPQMMQAMPLYVMAASPPMASRRM